MDAFVVIYKIKLRTNDTYQLHVEINFNAENNIHALRNILLKGGYETYFWRTESFDKTKALSGSEHTRWTFYSTELNKVQNYIFLSACRGRI